MTGREDLAARYGAEVVGHLDFLVATLGELEDIAARGRDAYLGDVVLQRAVEGCANRIGDTIKAKVPVELQDELGGREMWSDWVDWRVFLVHIYHRVDLTQVWRDLERDVPEFRRRLVAALGAD
ncbi:MAG TPA: hypothetical protein PKE40_00255 [Arachnia sp.]|nr:hypothetical protein [Arachnia sp.]HMT84756.1 hypothetical protein [Arachnia sp.]